MAQKFSVIMTGWPIGILPVLFMKGYREVTRHCKTKFATVKWYNLCLQMIQTQIVLSPF